MKETYSRTKSVWQRMNQEERQAVMDYGEKYKAFLDTARTERLAAAEIIRQAEEKGFKPVYDMKSLKPGDKVYWNQKGKSVILAVIGKEPVHEGIKIVGSHIDSPRLDLKANPVHEQEGVVYFRTHYYGGIKKYQWPTIPLALIGVIYTRDGKKVEINVGMKEGDPIFYVSDLLIHMAQDQMKKTLAEGITGEQLQAIAWTNAEDKVKPKEAFMKWLKDTYGIEEEDFATAELELVPATKSRDVGFDRSLIASYGQDDRVCSYANLEAILNAKPGVKTQAALLTDKEEIGSYGNTGLNSDFVLHYLEDLAATQGANIRKLLRNTTALSSDVNGAYDPSFASVYEERNSCFVNKGPVLTKYTGERGKSGSNDASAETMAKVISIMDEADVFWQIGELGAVDEGGGGTVALYVAAMDMDVVDLGVPILCMHSPFELSSKLDVYYTYKAFAAFLESDK